MSFKKSFFNPALFILNLRRFWPLAAVIFVVVLVYPGLAILGNAHPPVGQGQAQLYAAVSTAYSSAIPMVVLMAGAVIIAALAVFGHLHSRKKICFYHGLPIGRTAQFVTAFASAFVLVVGPILLGLLVCLGFGAGVSGLASALAHVALASVATFIALFALAAFACVVCGNALGAILVYVALNFSAVALSVGCAALTSTLLPGVPSDALLENVAERLTPIFQLLVASTTYSEWGGDGSLVAMGFQNPHFFVAYAVAGLVVLVLTAFLYRLRRDETAGETVSFAAVRVICMVLFALVVSVVGANLVLTLGFEARGVTVGVLVVLHLVFAAIGWFAAEMIVRRSVRVWDKRSLLSCAVLLVVMMALIGATRLNVLGLVTRVPDVGDVKETTVFMPRGRALSLDAEDAIGLHEVVLDNLDSTTGEYGLTDGERLEIVYELADGSTFRRVYVIERDDRDTPAYEGGIPASLRDSAITAACDELLKDPRYAHEFVFGFKPGDYDASDLRSTYVELWNDDGTAGSVISYPTDGVLFNGGYEFGAQGYGLYEAIREDLSQTDIDLYEYGSDPVSIGMVHFSWGNEPDSRFRDPSSTHPDQYSYVMVSKDMPKTLAWIEEHAPEADYRKTAG